MTTPNERRIRAGYDLFLAADVGNDADWDPGSPLAGLIAEDIVWYEDVGDPLNPIRTVQNRGTGGLQQTEPNSPSEGVLGRLRELRREMPQCQILSCLEYGAFVHTVDHALKQNADGKTGPQFCASSFNLDDTGKVKEVHYCSDQRQLYLPPDPPRPSA